MTKVFAYLRVSTREQTDGDGWPRQLSVCKKFCESKGWIIERDFKEQQSGSDEFQERTKMREILALAGGDSAHGIDTVVVERSDRIARDLMVQEIFLSKCREKKIKVFCADSGEEIVLAGADPTRILIRQILGALAQWDKAQLVLKLQAGRRKKANETGIPCGGPKAYGATPSERAVIDEIFFARKHGRIFSRIVKLLEEKGFPTPNGELVWTLSTVHKIFHREVKRREHEGGAQ